MEKIRNNGQMIQMGFFEVLPSIDLSRGYFPFFYYESFHVEGLAPDSYWPFFSGYHCFQRMLRDNTSVIS